MRIICFPNPKSLIDLEGDRSLATNLKSPAQLRAAVQIAVIDDQPFAPENNLRNNNFQIVSFVDIHRIDQIQDYPIVLCDLQGVGSQLAGELQGAYLIEEIKRNYPEKAVIAFTGGSANSTISKRAALAADNYLRKDVSIEDWRDVLDTHIQNLSNPIYVWRQFRIRLVKTGISPVDLMRLEHAYVSSIKSGATATKTAIESVANNRIVDPTIKSEIRNFIASKAFEILFEALKGYAT